MKTMIRRCGAFGTLLVVIMTLLVACGGSSTASVAPEERVKGFFTDFSAALNDPKLNEEAAQQQHIDKLTAYFAPSERAKQVESMNEMFKGMSGTEAVTMKIEGVTTEKVSESGDNAEVRITGGTMTMTLAGQTSTQNLGEAGFGGASGDTIKLKRESGVWYFVDQQ